MTDPVFRMIDLGDVNLRAATWGSGAPQIVMLHDGLGSITQWRTLPANVHSRTGVSVLAFERAGHGHSLPTPTGPWPGDWLGREAVVLGRLLAELAIEHPVLVGHSDGASTALLHATTEGAEVAGVLALAPHSWVEQICFDSILHMRQNRADFAEGLSRHHRHPDALFEAWSGVWVSDEFRGWDIRPILNRISVPTLIAQGADDAYATASHAHLTAAAIGANATSLIVPGVGHIMHHDDPDIVVDLIVDFVSEQL